MSKKYWNLYNHLFTLVLDSSYFPKLSQNTRKKLDKSIDRNHEKSVLWKRV